MLTWIPTQQQADKLRPRGAEGRLVGYVDGSHSMYQVVDLWEGCTGPVGMALTDDSLGCTEVHV